METILLVWLIMSAVYVVFDFKHFIEKWWHWIKLIGNGIFVGLKYIWEVIKSWTGKK
jgi:hypothetical protein